MTLPSEKWEQRWLALGYAFCSGLSRDEAAAAIGTTRESLNVTMKRKKKTRKALMQAYLRSQRIVPMRPTSQERKS